MKEVWQKPREGRYIYECDYCKRRNVREETMERHEKMCFYNPNRSECPWCGDASGKVWIVDNYYEDCPKCQIWREAQGEYK